MFQSPSFLLLSLASTSRLHSQIDLILHPSKGRGSYSVGMCAFCAFCSSCVCFHQSEFFLTAQGGEGYLNEEKKTSVAIHKGSSDSVIHRHGCQCWSKREEGNKKMHRQNCVCAKRREWPVGGAGRGRGWDCRGRRTDIWSWLDKTWITACLPGICFAVVLSGHDILKQLAAGHPEKHMKGH